MLVLGLVALFVYPGLSGDGAGDSADEASLEGAAAAPEPGSWAETAEAVAPGTPCAVSARACVDLDTQRAWLLRDGKVTRGPVPIASGGAGQETPLGHSFRVYRKNKDHVSGEFTGPDGNPAPMPWSVFFADGGVAFHPDPFVVFGVFDGHGVHPSFKR